MLVLEAGRPDYAWDLYIHMPAALSFPIGNRFYDWKYESEPEPFMHDRRIYHARGKVLGGSSSINGMIFQRGNPLDYERWAADPGMERWDYAHCLPYFKRMETCAAGADEWRGGDGPIVLERGAADEPALRRLPRGRAAGRLRADDDVNGARQEGFATFDRTIRSGRRVSAAVAYLRPVRSRPEPGACECRRFVTRIVFEGTRAVGVEVAGRGVSAPSEVILCGGAINSPQLLQLSGVGNAAELEALGVPVVHDLPGVGENLQDHLEVYVQHASKQPVSLAPAYKWRNRPLVGSRWLLFKNGPGATNHFEAGGFVALERRRRLPEPDVPLPADRGPLRRHGAAGARLPAARRADVLGRARLGEDRLDRSDASPGAPLQLPLDRPGPARMGRGDPRSRAILGQAAFERLRRRRALTGRRGAK